MAHHHAPSAAASHRGRLAAVFAITVVVLVVEVAGAALSGSLALLAAAGHRLDDGSGDAPAPPPRPRARRRGRDRPGPAGDPVRGPPGVPEADLRLLPPGDPGRGRQ